MLGKIRRHLGQHSFFPGMYQADGLHEVFPHETLEEVGSGAALSARNTCTSPA
jgi:hypothetical protein